PTRTDSTYRTELNARLAFPRGRRTPVIRAELREDWLMVGDHTADYLAGLPADQAAELDKVNGQGLTALRKHLHSGKAVAFLGAGVSTPLYPLWNGLISELVDAAAGRLEEREAQTCR